MTWTIPQIAVLITGLLHLAIMFLELLPWLRPLVMLSVLGKWETKFGVVFSELQRDRIATIVHNVAIYNGIVGATLIASAFAGTDVYLMQWVLLIGVIIAGLVGMTLSSLTVFQALAGAVALVIVMYYHSSAINPLP